MIIYSKFHRIKQSQITRSQFSRHLPSTIFLHRPINPIRVPISHVRLFRTNTSINILHIAIMRVQRGRDPDINLKREDLSRFLALKENRPFPSFLRDAAAYDVLPPLSLCALHLAGSILRACANAHHARTVAVCRLGWWLKEGKKGERANSGIFRPTNLRCLFSGLYNWIQNDGYPFYLAVSRHFNFHALQQRFWDLFYHIFQCVSFSLRFTRFTQLLT